ncbi:MAG: DUF4194 domain-containing protein [Lachnospiraceae bacterium]|nr:DUF4194 domain-containing protein [Lachnospiraceae bacterium]
MAIDIKEEIANYLLNNCFIIGNLDATRDKYYYVINHEDAFRSIFLPLGYTIIIHRNLRVVQLINNHGTGKLVLRKYESIILLILRLLYIQKRESLKTGADEVIASVEEIKNEYEKLNLPRKFKKELLEECLINIKKYNLATGLDKLTDTDARIQIYPSVMLAMPDSSISNAYDATYEFLQQYKGLEEDEDNEI